MIGVTGKPPAKGAVGGLGFSLCCNTFFGGQSQGGSVLHGAAPTGLGVGDAHGERRGADWSTVEWPFATSLGARGYHPRGDRKSAQVTEGVGLVGLPLRKRVRNCMKLQGLQGCDKKQRSWGTVEILQFPVGRSRICLLRRMLSTLTPGVLGKETAND